MSLEVEDVTQSFHIHAVTCTISIVYNINGKNIEVMCVIHPIIKVVEVVKSTNVLILQSIMNF